MLNSIQLMPVNIIQILTLFICVLGVCVFVTSKRYWGLVLALLFQALSMSFNLIEELRLFNDSIFITPAFTLTVGPCFYLFVRGLVLPERYISRRDFKHFILAILAVPFAQYTIWVLALGGMSQLVYLAVSLSLLNRYQNAIYERRSDPESLRLTWLFNLLLGLMVLIVTEAIRINLQPYLSYDTRNIWYLIDQVFILVVLCGIFVGLFNQEEVFSGLTEYEDSEQQPVTQEATEAVSVFREIDSWVKRDHLYLKPRLALGDIADITGMTTRDISWAINQGGKLSFSEYVNQLRVAKVEREMLMNSDKTLLDLALECGFSSKSSFNEVFKKHKGMSPSQYLKVQNLNSGR